MIRVVSGALVLIALAILSAAAFLTWEFLRINSHIDRCYDDTSGDYIWDAAERARFCGEASSSISKAPPQDRSPRPLFQGGRGFYELPATGVSKDEH